MVSNFERIFDEIKREANLIAPKYGLDADALVELVMNIVDSEDQHRIKSVARIHQKVKGMIQDVALLGSDGGRN